MEKISLAFGRRIMDNMLSTESGEIEKSNNFDMPAYYAAISFHAGWMKAKAGIAYDDTLSFWWKAGWMEATADNATA